jgi:drug/metabolite transporter (DMT)-like permease
MIVSFTGSVIIILSSNTDQRSSTSEQSYLVGVFLCLLATTFNAVVYVILRYLKTVHHSIVASFQVKGIFILSFLTLLIYRLFINPNGFEYNMTLSQFCLLFGNGVVMFVCQLLFIFSMRLNKAGRAAGLSFISIVMGYAIDTLLFGYSMSVIEILGALLVIGCSVLALVLKYKKVI